MPMGGEPTRVNIPAPDTSGPRRAKKRTQRGGTHRMFRKLAVSAWFVCAALAATGCSHTIRISRTRPAEFTIKPNQKVALVVEADGSAPSATNVMDAAIGLG